MWLGMLGRDVAVATLLALTLLGGPLPVAASGPSTGSLESLSPERVGLTGGADRAAGPTGRVSAAVVVGTTDPVPRATGPVPERLASALHRALLRAREDLHLPSITVAVVLPDGRAWREAVGRAVVGRHALAAGPRTPYVAGSITKTFVAALVLQLVDEGRLSLSDHIDRWFPARRDAEAITVRMLLDHTSGLFDYFDNPRYEGLVFGRPRHSWTVREILSLELGPTAPPGARYDYSNTNYVLLARIAERLTGESIGSLLRERFFDPFGLRNTLFQGEDPIPRIPAAGYLWYGGPYLGYGDGTRFRTNTSAATVAWAAGAILSTPGDLARWARALYSGEVLGPELTAEMLAFDGSVYALGVRRARFADRRAIGHTGSLRGFIAGAFHFRDDGVTLALMTNRGRIDADALIDRFARAIFRHLVPPS